MRRAAGRVVVVGRGVGSDGVGAGGLRVQAFDGETWATIELTSSAERSPVSPREPLACFNLVGGSTAHAADVLDKQNLTIDWRLAVYQALNGKTWTTTEVESVPAGAIVEDVERANATTVYVFVHRASDRYAPGPTPTVCRAP